MMSPDKNMSQLFQKLLALGYTQADLQKRFPSMFGNSEGPAGPDPIDRFDPIPSNPARDMQSVFDYLGNQNSLPQQFPSQNVPALPQYNLPSMPDPLANQYMTDPMQSVSPALGSFIEQNETKPLQLPPAEVAPSVPPPQREGYLNVAPTIMPEPASMPPLQSAVPVTEPSSVAAPAGEAMDRAGLEAIILADQRRRDREAQRAQENALAMEELAKMRGQPTDTDAVARAQSSYFDYAGMAGDEGPAGDPIPGVSAPEDTATDRRQPPKPQINDDMSFSEAFRAGRQNRLAGGPQTFTWRGNTYGTLLKGESYDQKPKKSGEGRKSMSSATSESGPYDDMSFSKAFALARKSRLDGGPATFTWRGNLYGTKLVGEK